jgi:NAD(P)-dependent dehydrogenase (short-subunit alcohol dehydrogenase family)
MRKGFACFKNKVAIVTGSTMGIGKALALELCQRGAKVVINGRNRVRLEQTVNEFSGQGYNVTSCLADVTDFGDCARLIDAAVKNFGRIDILITNAGIVGYSSFENFDPAEYRKAIDSNIYGSLFPAKAALPHLKESEGSLVFISSLAGMIGMPNYSAYSMGKMSLTALSQSLRTELKNTGVHVGIVYISFVKNEDQKRFISSDGSLVPVPPRRPWLQQPREKVARSVLNLIQHRRPKAVLSAFGKLTELVIRFIPGLARVIIAEKMDRRNS